MLVSEKHSTDFFKNNFEIGHLVDNWAYLVYPLLMGGDENADKWVLSSRLSSQTGGSACAHMRVCLLGVCLQCSHQRQQVFRKELFLKYPGWSWWVSCRAGCERGVGSCLLPQVSEPMRAWVCMCVCTCAGED